MAHAEDTELRDLVIEALEKNGSLAKIRALLRANIFLAFEDECENIKQNVSLDNILKLPEGILALSVIHEFLNFCNLKNTLFVYMSESRQGKDYTYEGEKQVVDKLNLADLRNEREPVLVKLIRIILNNEKCKRSNQDRKTDDQNCTYIVHEDSSTTTSQSQSDNSSDEKNKLHLRLPLDNSDTDTSSDSAREKTSSEYIPNKNIHTRTENTINFLSQSPKQGITQKNNEQNIDIENLHKLKISNNSSTESTSYVELKPFNPLDEVLLNTTGLPLADSNSIQQNSQHSNSQSSKIESASPIHALSSASTGSLKNDSSLKVNKSSNNSPQESMKYEAAEYSYDFSPSPTSRNKEAESQANSQEYLQLDAIKKSSKNSSIESQHCNSQSSQSSVSISDVADLISEKSSLSLNHNIISSSNKSKSITNQSNKNTKKDQTKMLSDDSGDFSESPVPSLSNLSLDIHSE